MAFIHFIDGEKGGVGKSWVARTCLQYFIDAGNPAGRPAGAESIPFMGIESDRSNPSLDIVYRDHTDYAVFSEDQKLADEADELFDLALTKHLIVNLPAQVHRPMTKWIRQKGLIEFAANSRISLVKWFVCDGEKDSIELFVKSVEELGNEIPHVLVKNFGRCDEWGYFEAHAQAQAAIEKYNVKVINFPELSANKRIAINAESMTFAQAREYPGFPTLGRHQIVVYLRQAYEALESTGFLPQWKLVDPVPLTTPATPTAPASESKEATVKEPAKKRTTAKAKAKAEAGAEAEATETASTTA